MTMLNLPMAALEQLTTEDIWRNTSYYDSYPMADGWSRATKQDNFRRLIEIAEIAGFPLAGSDWLDEGCGTGDLVKLLRDCGIRNYLGVDIYNPSIERARRKYPRELFLNRDILVENLVEKFDYAVCSGGLSVALVSDNYDFLEGMVSKMWKYARRGVAFNFLPDYTPPKQKFSSGFFYRIDRVIAICQAIAPHVKCTPYQSPSKLDHVQVFLYGK